MPSLEVDTFDTIRQLLGASERDDLDRVFGSFTKGIGGEFWTAVQISDGAGILPALPKEIGRPPVAWQARFREQRYAHDDLAVLDVMRARPPFFLDELDGDPRLSDRGRMIMGERTEHGLGCGVVCSFPLSDGSTWALCCWGSAMERAPDVKIAVGMAGQVYTARSAARSADCRLNLTPRMIQILELLRLGNTHAQTAHVLGISVRTVENLMREARERTGIATTPALLAHAQARGLFMMPGEVR